MRSKTKRVVVQFAFKLGYYLEELDYVEPKTASFKRFPEFWREPNLHEWWVGVKEKTGERMAMRSK